jgi:hypothetical protein
VKAGMPAPVYIDKNEGLFPMRRLAELVDSKCRQPLAEYFSVSLRWYRDLQGELLWGPRSCSKFDCSFIHSARSRQ